MREWCLRRFPSFTSSFQQLAGCLLNFARGSLFFILVSSLHIRLFTFKNTKIYYLCSYSRKAFAHVVAVSVTFIVTLLFFFVPQTSNILRHEIQVNNIRTKRKKKKKRKKFFEELMHNVVWERKERELEQREMASFRLFFNKVCTV